MTVWNSMAKKGCGRCGWQSHRAAFYGLIVSLFVLVPSCKKNGTKVEDNVITVELPERVQVSKSGTPMNSQGSSPAPVKTAPPPAKAPPAVKSVPSLAKTPAGLAFLKPAVVNRDPFRSYLMWPSEIETFGGGMGADIDVEADSLRDFDIRNFRYVGIILGAGAPFALVEDPARIGHTVQQGSLIGRNGGRVQSITEEQMVIREDRRDSAGKLRTVYVTLKLGR